MPSSAAAAVAVAVAAAVVPVFFYRFSSPFRREGATASVFL